MMEKKPTRETVIESATGLLIVYVGMILAYMVVEHYIADAPFLIRAVSLLGLHFTIYNLIYIAYGFTVLIALAFRRKK